MNVAKKTILLTALMMCQNALAENSYLVNFGDDLWSSDLLIETCPYKLSRAVNQVAEHLSGFEQDLVAVMPEHIGYQYFVVEFKRLEDSALVDLEEPLFYQFQYWTYYDEHKRCLKIEPYRMVDKPLF